MNALAPYLPMSSTAIICSTVLGFIAAHNLSPFRNQGEVRFSMKNTGRMITQEGKPRPRTVCSMRHLFSKCGIPAWRCADPTDEYTKC